MIGVFKKAPIFKKSFILYCFFLVFIQKIVTMEDNAVINGENLAKQILARRVQTICGHVKPYIIEHSEQDAPMDNHYNSFYKKVLLGALTIGASMQGMDQSMVLSKIQNTGHFDNSMGQKIDLSKSKIFDIVQNSDVEHSPKHQSTLDFHTEDNGFGNIQDSNTHLNDLKMAEYESKHELIHTKYLSTQYKTVGTEEILTIGFNWPKIKNKNLHEYGPKLENLYDHFKSDTYTKQKEKWINNPTSQNARPLILACTNYIECAKLYKEGLDFEIINSTKLNNKARSTFVGLTIKLGKEIPACSKKLNEYLEQSFLSFEIHFNSDIYKQQNNEWSNNPTYKNASPLIITCTDYIEFAEQYKKQIESELANPTLDDNKKREFTNLKTRFEKEIPIYSERLNDYLKNSLLSLESHLNSDIYNKQDEEWRNNPTYTNALPLILASTDYIACAERYKKQIESELANPILDDNKKVEFISLKKELERTISVYFEKVNYYKKVSLSAISAISIIDFNEEEKDHEKNGKNPLTREQWNAYKLEQWKAYDELIGLDIVIQSKFKNIKGLIKEKKSITFIQDSLIKNLNEITLLLGKITNGRDDAIRIQFIQDILYNIDDKKCSFEDMEKYHQQFNEVVKTTKGIMNGSLNDSKILTESDLKQNNQKKDKPTFTLKVSPEYVQCIKQKKEIEQEILNMVLKVNAKQTLKDKDEIIKEFNLPAYESKINKWGKNDEKAKELLGYINQFKQYAEKFKNQNEFKSNINDRIAIVNSSEYLLDQAKAVKCLPDRELMKDYWDENDEEVKELQRHFNKLQKIKRYFQNQCEYYMKVLKGNSHFNQMFEAYNFLIDVAFNKDEYPVQDDINTKFFKWKEKNEKVIQDCSDFNEQILKHHTILTLQDVPEKDKKEAVKFLLENEAILPQGSFFNTWKDNPDNQPIIEKINKLIEAEKNLSKNHLNDQPIENKNSVSLNNNAKAEYFDIPPQSNNSDVENNNSVRFQKNGEVVKFDTEDTEKGNLSEEDSNNGKEEDKDSEATVLNLDEIKRNLKLEQDRIEQEILYMVLKVNEKQTLKEKDKIIKDWFNLPAYESKIKDKWGENDEKAKELQEYINQFKQNAISLETHRDHVKYDMGNVKRNIESKTSLIDKVEAAEKPFSYYQELIEKFWNKDDEDAKELQECVDLIKRNEISLETARNNIKHEIEKVTQDIKSKITLIDKVEIGNTIDLHNPNIIKDIWNEKDKEAIKLQQYINQLLKNEKVFQEKCKKEMEILESSILSAEAKYPSYSFLNTVFHGKKHPMPNDIKQSFEKWYKNEDNKKFQDDYDQFIEEAKNNYRNLREESSSIEDKKNAFVSLLKNKSKIPQYLRRCFEDWIKSSNNSTTFQEINEKLKQDQKQQFVEQPKTSWSFLNWLNPFNWFSNTVDAPKKQEPVHTNGSATLNGHNGSNKKRTNLLGWFFSRISWW